MGVGGIRPLGGPRRAEKKNVNSVGNMSILQRKRGLSLTCLPPDGAHLITLMPGQSMMGIDGRAGLLAINMM